MATKCTRDELGAILNQVGADRDAGGRFLLSWPQGSRGFSGSSSRISVEEIDFRIRGRWRRLGPVVDLNRPRNLSLWPELDSRDTGSDRSKNGSEADLWNGKKAH